MFYMQYMEDYRHIDTEVVDNRPDVPCERGFQRQDGVVASLVRASRWPSTSDSSLLWLFRFVLERKSYCGAYSLHLQRADDGIEPPQTLHQIPPIPLQGHISFARVTVHSYFPYRGRGGTRR